MLLHLSEMSDDCHAAPTSHCHSISLCVTVSMFLCDSWYLTVSYCSVLSLTPSPLYLTVSLCLSVSFAVQLDVEFVIFTVLPKIKKLERSISLAIDDVEQLPIVKFRLDRIDCVYTKSQVCPVYIHCTLYEKDREL